jgi:aminopeptidase N
MENASAIFYASDLFAKRTLKDDIIAHEVAHQWFGDAVTPREFAHLWLSEGLVNYFGALWTQYIRGDAPFQREMAKVRQKILTDSVVASRPVVDTAQRNYLDLLNTNSYDKGNYIAYLLHRQLGDSAFFRGIRSYYASHRHGTVVSDDLRRALEQASGQPLTQFFAQWLTRPGVAEPVVGWVHDARDSTVSLVVIQEGARGAYELPLPVVLRDAEGRDQALVVAIPAQARATVAVPGRYSSKPSSLRFDPDTLLLARISRP